MRCYVVDAFTDVVFRGNSAAVCILDAWLSEPLMQAIAMENNLSETVFTVKGEAGYDLRWFTPNGEIDLCGHATLACAYVIMRFIEPAVDRLCFHTKSGALTVNKRGDLYEVDMPAYQLNSVPVTDEMAQAIGFRPCEAWMGRDLICVLENEQEVWDARPDAEQLKQLEGLLLHLTAKGTQYDCVTRSFAPKLGVFEDPVCGSGHCHVVPLWADKLEKDKIRAYQASKRGALLYCERDGARVRIAGQAALYSIAEIFVEEGAQAHL